MVCMMVLERLLCVILLGFTPLAAAEWVKISVLAPEKHEVAMEDASDPGIPKDQENVKPNAFNSRILASENADQNEGIGEQEVDEETMPALNSNSTIDSFMQSVMNNSQKVEEDKMEFSSFPNNMFLPSKFLKNIHRTLLFQAPTSNRGKVALLESLKQKLYSYIRPKLALFWDLKDKDRSRGRGMDKGMSFPSMDGALMTISFLLFAVFLIKLVQQLIQQVQDKANAQAMLMTGATPVVPAMPAVPAPAGGRRKREIPPDVYAAAQLFRLIEKFHTNS